MEYQVIIYKIYNLNLLNGIINLKDLKIDIIILKLAIMVSDEIENYDYIKKLIEFNHHKKYNTDLILFCKDNNYEYMLKVLEYI